MIHASWVSFPAGMNANSSTFDYSIAVPVVGGFYFLGWHVFSVITWAKNGFKIAPAFTFFQHRVFLSYVSVAGTCYIDDSLVCASRGILSAPYNDRSVASHVLHVMFRLV